MDTIHGFTTLNTARGEVVPICPGSDEIDGLLSTLLALLVFLICSIILLTEVLVLCFLFSAPLLCWVYSRKRSVPNGEYEQLKENEIRLIKLLPGSDSDIKCELLHALPDASDYEALSYCWGLVENPQRIGINQSNFYVTPTLYRALYSLRDPQHPRTMWIDQICIDQDDKAEKSKPVERMGEIYKKARRVVVWLGEELPHLQSAFEVIKGWKNSAPGDMEATWTPDSKWKKDLSEIL